MNKTILLLLFGLGTFLNSYAQTRIDEAIPFQSDPTKQYSIYIPSTYDAASPNKLMLGLHPLNTDRWDAMSWCDTLINFAEANNLLLICPDGGDDGAIDDPIDTAFTTAILDSMMLWYNVESSEVYAMGFSWGGRTTYTYGLNHVDRFAGFMPIGAAVTGTNQVNGILDNAEDKPFYIIHGSLDSPNTRFTPIRDALIEANACVESNYLIGVGHTIDFPNRNSILNEGFQWLESIACGQTTNTVAIANPKIKLFPNPVQTGNDLIIDKAQVLSIELFDTKGNLLKTYQQTNRLPTANLKGLYFIKITSDKGESVHKFMVQ